MPQKKKPRNYALNKRAFDTVLDYVRRVESLTLGGGVGAIQLDSSGGGGTRDTARPTPVEFRCDVQLAISMKLPKNINRALFDAAYLEYDSEEAMDREIYAQKVLGDKRHSAEQRLGEEFVRRGLFPIQGKKGYFFHLRKPRP